MGSFLGGNIFIWSISIEIVYYICMFNPFIAVPLAVWAITQLTKFTISGIMGDIDLRKLYASGGMPSVHSAVVVSLATTALVIAGADSQIFGFCAVFAAIVMYDALGVRKAVGDQGIALNKVITSLKRQNIRLAEPDLEVKEVLGHTYLEVVAGAIVGVFFALMFNYQHITPFTDFLTQNPSIVELLCYGVLAILILITGGIQFFILARKRSRALLSFSKKLLFALWVSGLLLAGFAFSEFEKAAYLSWRVWAILTVLTLVIWLLIIFILYFNKLKNDMANEGENARKQKWLPKRKKRNKK